MKAALLPLACLLYAASALPLAAQTSSRWRVGAGYAPMVGLRAEFSGFGDFQNPLPALPAPGPGQNYFYLDGSVQVDSSGNAGGLTTFWSYNNAAQYDPTAFGGQGAINFNGLAGGLNNAGTAAESNIAAAAGFDLYGYLHLGDLSIPNNTGRSASWGLRMGAQYSRVDVTNRDTLNSGVATVTDSFNLNGVIPPGAPYTGTFLGPGPLLGDTPVRTTGTAVAAISGSRQLDLHLLAAQFGSYVEFPVTKKVDVMLEGGLIMALATGSYRYESSVTVAGAGTQTSNGYESTTRLLPGFYTGIGLTYNITDHFGIQSAVRYQFMRQFDMNANGSTARLSFDTAFVLSLSAIYRF